jgi:hypothetical protein
MKAIGSLQSVLLETIGRQFDCTENHTGLLTANAYCAAIADARGSACDRR